MKVGINKPFHVIEAEHGDIIQLLVPACLGQTCVYLEITNEGKLEIIGDSSVIEKISAKGIR